MQRSKVVKDNASYPLLGVHWRAGLNPAGPSSLRQLSVHQIKVVGVAQLLSERRLAANKGTLPVNNSVVASSEGVILLDLILLQQPCSVIATFT